MLACLFFSIPPDRPLAGRVCCQPCTFQNVLTSCRNNKQVTNANMTDAAATRAGSRYGYSRKRVYDGGNRRGTGLARRPPTSGARVVPMVRAGEKIAKPWTRFVLSQISPTIVLDSTPHPASNPTNAISRERQCLLTKAPGENSRPHMLAKTESDATDGPEAQKNDNDRTTAHFVG